MTNTDYDVHELIARVTDVTDARLGTLSATTYQLPDVPACYVALANYDRRDGEFIAFRETIVPLDDAEAAEQQLRECFAWLLNSSYAH
jgi:hypothetical protein